MSSERFYEASIPPTCTNDSAYGRILEMLMSRRTEIGALLDPVLLSQELDLDRIATAKALHRLQRERLVDADAAGVFRVVTPTADEYDHALRAIFGMAEIAARWAVPALVDEEVALLVDALESIHEASRRTEPVSLSFAIDDLIGPLMTATPNPVFERAALAVLSESRFLFLSRPEFMFWDIGAHVDAFSAALRARDGEAAAAGIRVLSVAVLQHLVDIRSIRTDAENSA